MNKKKLDKINWQDKRYYDMLIDQRKFMWHPDMLDIYARWLGLEQGLTAVDVGCGLGYLGYTYWRYFGNGGRYFGIDLDHKLLCNATETASEWAQDGDSAFVNGSAYSLPFPDNFADWTMCQTLLMHLEFPQKALAEIVRITKPGGLIVCKEPDNLSSGLGQGWDTIPELSVEEQVLFQKLTIIANIGRKKLGLGDNQIGAKIPKMMNDLGLVDIDARQNDGIRFLVPPYNEPKQVNLLDMILKSIDDDAAGEAKERGREMYIAGGGDGEEYDEAVKIGDRYRAELKEQIANEEYFSCGSGHFYIFKARKPE